MSFSYHPISREGVQGIPVAVIRGGEKDGVCIYLYGDTKDLNEEYSHDEMRYIVSDIIDELIMYHRMKIDVKDKLKLEADIISKLEPRDRKLSRIYCEVWAIINERNGKQVVIGDDNDIKLEPVPMIEPHQRSTIYVSGGSGSGKSTWAAKYANNWIETFHGITNDNSSIPKVYLFSCKDTDHVLDQIENLIRVPMDDNFCYEYRKGGMIDVYANSLVIFDDIEAIKDKEVSSAIQGLKSDIMTLGRDPNIWVISIMHKGLGGAKTMTELSEANIIVLFPKSNNAEAKKVLKNYCGIEGTKLSKTLDQKSRWVMFRRGHPNFVLTEKSLYLV